MKIYIDSNYHCHTTNPDDVYREIETDFFNGKCDAFIEGHLYIPIGENWTTPNGTVTNVGYRAPWKTYAELAAAQAQYERMMAEAEAAYREGVDSVD